MLPLFLILGLFLFFTLIGQAVLAGLKVRFGVLWSWLLSPTMGMGITVLVINSFSKWGQPVGAIGPGATIGMAVVAIGILLWRRPSFPRRALWPHRALPPRRPRGVRPAASAGPRRAARSYQSPVGPIQALISSSP